MPNLNERNETVRTITTLNVVFLVSIQPVVWVYFFVDDYQRPYGRAYAPVVAWVVSIGLVLLLAGTLYTAVQESSGWIPAIGLLGTFSAVVVIFAQLYFRYGTRQNFNIRLTHVDALLFSLGTLTTAGTGDISPRSETVRRILTLQMAADVVLVVFITGVALSIFGSRLRKP